MSFVSTHKSTPLQINNDKNIIEDVSYLKTAPDMYNIIDISRWAPSGDNSQPWTFEIIDADHITVYLTFERDNIYEYNKGQPVFLSGGGLIETMRIAATHHGRACYITHAFMNEVTDEYVINLHMPLDSSVVKSNLYNEIPNRSVHRYAYRTTPLTSEMVLELESSLGPNFSIMWHSTWREKLSFIRMNMLGTLIRTSIPETYPIHAKIFKKLSYDSEIGIPAQASGFSFLSAMIMMWAIKKWKRVSFLNKFMGGPLLSRLELDIIPGLNTASFFTLYFKSGSQTPPTPDKLIEAGAAMQRFWLTATKLGLKLQPSFAPLIFATYSEQNVLFTSQQKYLKIAQKLLHHTKNFWSIPLNHIFFLGRIGIPYTHKKPLIRSTRLATNSLLRPHKIN